MDVTSHGGSDTDWMAIAQTSSNAVSGDCARVVARTNGETLFFVGDVAGHDVRAGRLARQVDAFVTRWGPEASPKTLLTRLNAVMVATWPSDLFVSAVCFSIDPANGRAVIAAAGQLPPVIKGVTSSSTVEVHVGLPLGICAGHRYFERALRLAAGDVLVAVTDGVTDPLATGSDLLGLSELSRLVDLAPPEPVRVCASLLRAVRRSGPADDATVVAVAPGQREVAPCISAVRPGARLAA